MWAATAAVAVSAMVLTISFGGIGAVVVVPAFMWLGQRAQIGRAQHGVLLGLAALPAWLAAINWDYQPCPASAADMADGNWTCGGTNPLPFVIATAVIVLAFLLVWRLAKWRRPD